jgi:hypothetical protein
MSDPNTSVSSFNVAFSPPPDAPPIPAPNLEAVAKFMFLLSERYPIDRTIGNFQGNHFIVYDTTHLNRSMPGLTVHVWVWKQLEWRCYPVGLTDDDLKLDAESLLNEISRALEPELAKLIVPTMPRAPKTPLVKS